MTTEEARLPTRQLIQPDVPRFDRRTLKPEARDALTELLLTMADDEFVLGFWDSEWTGIAPVLEEDVAFSSMAQDEIGHARVWYEMLAQLTGDGADRLAFHREPEHFQHARLLDHPRTDWAFSIARRWLYDTADSGAPRRLGRFVLRAAGRRRCQGPARRALPPDAHGRVASPHGRTRR